MNVTLCWIFPAESRSHLIPSYPWDASPPGRRDIRPDRGGRGAYARPGRCAASASLCVVRHVVAHDAAGGQVVYLTEHGERLAAIVPAELAAELGLSRSGRNSASECDIWPLRAGVRSGPDGESVTCGPWSSPVSSRSSRPLRLPSGLAIGSAHECCFDQDLRHHESGDQGPSGLLPSPSSTRLIMAYLSGDRREQPGVIRRRRISYAVSGPRLPASRCGVTGRAACTEPLELRGSRARATRPDPGPGAARSPALTEGGADNEVSHYRSGARRPADGSGDAGVRRGLRQRRDVAGHLDPGDSHLHRGHLPRPPPPRPRPAWARSR